MARLQEKINTLADFYRSILKEQTRENPIFAGKLAGWFAKQKRKFRRRPADFDYAAKCTAYLLINKILFSHLLRAKESRALAAFAFPDDFKRLRSTLRNYFKQVLKIDYEALYTADFIEKIAFPKTRAMAIVKEIEAASGVFKTYDFSRLGYDVIGRVFERLIPSDARHDFGQYFTSPEVVDLILRFCVEHEDAAILDPACGAGMFLVRAYQHKKMLNRRLPHEKILATLWGSEIAPFPAHLAKINLAINDLKAAPNQPNIIQQDFFDWRAGADEALDHKKRKNVQAEEAALPRWFDAVVGNPPYTRQEEMNKISSTAAAYKENLIDKAVYFRRQKMAAIGKRAGIHAYFFVHGAKFLKEGGFFGFVVSDSWLDVDYGKGLQEFFLDHYKIVAIIASQVERWFAEAGVNTCIVILQKCSNRQRREANAVRFVYLKKPLRCWIPPARDGWEKQVARFNAIDRLKRDILAQADFGESECWRIFPKSQKELREEGTDSVSRKYVGTKWGKYLRAPEIFFKILAKGKDKLAPLGEVAQIRRGFTTGADPWFYVTDVTDSTSTKEIRQLSSRMGYEGKLADLRLIQSGDGTRWLVEKEFLQPVIRNPENYKNIFIDVQSIRDFAVIVNETKENIKGKLIAKYLRHGEKKAYQMGKNRTLVPAETRTCSSRQKWYQLSSLEPSRLLWQKAFDVYHRHYLASGNVLANQRFYHVYPQANDGEFIAAVLNSTFVAMYLEFQRSIMGLGAIEATVEEAKQTLVIQPPAVSASTRNRLAHALSRLGRREVGSIFDEIGASSSEEVSLDKVKPDRRELDHIVLREILALTEAEQVEVYRAVVDAAKLRLEKAKSRR
ncbi:MAG: N-6 DNA methylase [candidate division KSB1 bacterium]|nr:N-6 DNA methylase [candidate division KSB1 bacterium]MDZ7366920.1 N-6 DNA methylase [candidate division KSB1 bacterium]MDZ7406089.1 N-6 DNA methylase [candidate division KSB1 bacterium]